MLIVKGSVESCGIDFVTLTKTTSDTARTSIERIWDKISLAGNLEQVRWGGYQGFKEGPMRVGRRTRGGDVDRILTVSGSPANDVLRADEKDLRDAKCTRIDLQVTIKLDERDRDLAKDFFGSLKESASYKKSMVGRRNIRLIDGLDGQTLYVGERTSKKLMVRVYDKSRDLGYQAGQAWRFEVEYKRDTATAVLGRVLDSDDAETRVLGGVVDALEGICGILLPKKAHPLILVPDDYEEKDTVAWLERCVRPVVVAMANEGRANEAIEALGLAWLLEMTQVEQRLISQEVDRREKERLSAGALTGTASQC